MTRTSFTARRADGDAIVERFTKAKSLPPDAKRDFAAFAKRHRAFVVADRAVTAAERAFEAALSAVGSADGARDRAVDALADALPAAKLGSRDAPFADFSPHAPSALKALGHQPETLAVDALLGALDGARPPAAIAKLTADLAKKNAAVRDALSALADPQRALDEARRARDAMLADWDRDLRRLRESTRFGFRDVAGRAAALLASAMDVVARALPKKGRARAAKGASAAAGAGTGAGAGSAAGSSASPGSAGATAATSAASAAKRKTKKRRARR